MPKKTNSNEFFDKVREVVKSIPTGTTMSYKEVATVAGRPKAARIVANLMAQNYDVTIPCHRVIRSDGALGGYNRGGEAVKKQILAREGAL